MKGFIYDFGQGKSWADFSGDYNPIHFDLNAAAALNQTALIVHGMRVIADIKRDTLPKDGCRKNKPPVTVRFSARFENPVLCGVVYSLCSHKNNQKVVFKLIEPSCESIHIRGSVSEAYAPQITHIISEKKLTKQHIDEVNKLWPVEIEKSGIIFLPLVMFRELFKNPELFRTNLLHECPHVLSLGELLAEKKVMQTHYDLYYNTPLPDINKKSVDGMIIRTGKPSVIGSNDYGWLIQIQSAVKTGSTTLMQISVTLKIISESQEK
ncbi:MaoC/PaaZ C-terminal domain-containing protein [Enterobacter pseudoroggenkampii]|uniref:MaoC/PaaZ C-terminal domain-containing protein n=1 Tax=Enterobacter pseudoroggenkampii TaxID=2996112 RepID=UPI00294074F3|nr:hypothetical protein [Citrobacter amalonaticus]